jgi:hypothetical protein
MTVTINFCHSTAYLSWWTIIVDIQRPCHHRLVTPTLNCHFTATLVIDGGPPHRASG